MSINVGLEGVVVAETALSMVDGENGRLVIAGNEVGALSGQRSFDAVFAQLLGAAGSPQHAAGERATALGAGRQSAFAQLERCHEALRTPVGMDALRACLALLPDSSEAAIVGAAAVFTAAWWRLRGGVAPLAPDPAAGHAQDLHRMLTGTRDAAAAAALDAYLTAVIDHGMNASTFTARVVASTGSDRTSAVVAAIGALKGPLHGGAPGPVLDMLDAVGTADNAPTWVEAELATGRRIMGMGHRVYRVRDPRAAVLETALRKLAHARLANPSPSLTGQSASTPQAGERAELALAVERAAQTALGARHPDRPIRANVEFFTAVLLEGIGIDRALFSPLFACSRAAGWCAHVAEQRAKGRLIRPRARYIGRGGAIVTG
jgi:citrate synthase